MRDEFMWHLLNYLIIINQFRYIDEFEVSVHTYEF